MPQYFVHIIVVPEPLSEPDKRISHTSGSSDSHSVSLRSTKRVQVFADFYGGPIKLGKCPLKLFPAPLNVIWLGCSDCSVAFRSYSIWFFGHIQSGTQNHTPQNHDFVIHDYVIPINSPSALTATFVRARPNRSGLQCCNYNGLLYTVTPNNKSLNQSRRSGRNQVES